MAFDKVLLNGFLAKLIRRNVAYCCFLYMFSTGSIASSAKRRLFKLLRGRFWGFSPRMGDTLHRWGEIWHGGGDLGGPSVPPPCQNRWNDKCI